MNQERGVGFFDLLFLITHISIFFFSISRAHQIIIFSKTSAFLFFPVQPARPPSVFLSQHTKIKDRSASLPWNSQKHKEMIPFLLTTHLPTFPIYYLT
ncbi:hypothetical protein V8F33_000538 [Rhypophila sp. PSN 637]